MMIVVRLNGEWRKLGEEFMKGADRVVGEKLFPLAEELITREHVMKVIGKRDRNDMWKYCFMQKWLP